MQVAELQDGEAVEGGRQPRGDDGIAAHLDPAHVAPCAAVETCDPQTQPDHRVRRIPPLDLEEVEPRAEAVRLVILLYAQSLPGMGWAQPLLQPGDNIVVAQPAAAGIRCGPEGAARPAPAGHGRAQAPTRPAAASPPDRPGPR